MFDLGSLAFFNNCLNFHLICLILMKFLRLTPTLELSHPVMESTIDCEQHTSVHNSQSAVHTLEYLYLKSPGGNRLPENMSEEGQKVKWLKHCEYNNQNEENNPNYVNNDFLSHVCVCVCVYMCLCMYIHIYVCHCIYIYIYIVLIRYTGHCLRNKNKFISNLLL